MQLNHLMLVLMFKTCLAENVAIKSFPHLMGSRFAGSGVAAYLEVNETAVQEKLDEFNQREVNGKQGPQLYLPKRKFFEDILTTDHHVIFFVVGSMDSVDTHDDTSLPSNATLSSIVIPFLADDPDGVPKYSLEMNQFYDRIISGENVIFPSRVIDEITVTETGAVLKYGSDELIISFVKSTPCKVPSNIRRQEFDAFIEGEYAFTFSKKLDLGYCDHTSLAGNQFCEMLENIKPELEEEFPNVCEYISRASRVERCEASFAITNITKGFRDLLLLKDGPINVVASESIKSDYFTGVKYPCIE